MFASFPEVTKVVSQVGRPDDGTDPSLFSNTEYFIDLKPKENWRPVFRENKEELIRAMARESEKIPGALWNFSQPIADNMEEAVSGVKGELAIKIFGTDLKQLEAKGDELLRLMGTIQGVQDLGLFRVIGQPNLNISVDRQRPHDSDLKLPMSRTPLRLPLVAKPWVKYSKASNTTIWSFAISRNIEPLWTLSRTSD